MRLRGLMPVLGLLVLCAPALTAGPAAPGCAAEGACAVTETAPLVGPAAGLLSGCLDAPALSAAEPLAGGHSARNTGQAAAHPGSGFGLELCMGMQGILSYFQLGVQFPRIKGALFFGLGARMASSLTWATFHNLETDELVSFHPVMAAGVLSFGGSSPLVYNVLRMHGGMDLLLGYSFTPYDNAIYGTGNLIGDNLSFAILGYFGIELFTAPRLSMFLDAGGGYKSMFADGSNPYVVASGWLGSGVGLRMGLRFYP
jgi:hypothetical protein